MNNSSQWTAVPENVRHLFIKYAAEARSLRDNNAPVSDCYIDTEEVGRIYLCKQAQQPSAPFKPTTGKPIMDAFRSVGRAMGGPNPLTSTLTGGALGAALGYGGVCLLQKLFPDKYVEDGPLARNIAIAGALGLGGASG